MQSQLGKHAEEKELNRVQEINFPIKVILHPTLSVTSRLLYQVLIVIHVLKCLEQDEYEADKSWECHVLKPEAEASNMHLFHSWSDKRHSYVH